MSNIHSALSRHSTRQILRVAYCNIGMSSGLVHISTVIMNVYLHSESLYSSVITATTRQRLKDSPGATHNPIPQKILTI